MREVYDIECLTGLFLYVGKNVDSGEYYVYEISKYQNDIDSLVKHLLDGGIQYGVSYNGLGYDSQILQFIIDNYERWVDLNGLGITQKIKLFSNRVIDDTKYGLFPPYREDHLDVTQIDLFKIHHFDNENRRTSLKWLQFSMDFPNVEEMPIHHETKDLSTEDIQLIKEYCFNDVESTYQLYLVTIGQSENPFYKGQNKIQDRFDLIQEMGFPLRALSWSDVKIGDEINKKVYMKTVGLDYNNSNDHRKLGDIRRNRKSTAGFTYGQCIPSYVSFQTPEFQSFFNRMKKVRVNLMKKEEYPFSYNGTHYMIAKGGIHSNEKNRIITPGPNEILRDADIGSQYPHSIIKRNLFPNHLGKGWLIGYTGTRDKRLQFKELAGKELKYKGLAEQYKLALNGGGFGKTNEMSNWQYDPFVHYSCTIGNQFEILMLIESLEIAGIHVVSANTDGIVCLFNKQLEETYNRICHEWEIKVGNSVQGKLEFTDYTSLIQSSVNDYLAIKTNGKVKKKGDFATDMELHKNKSRRIIPIAMEQYFVNGIPVEQTIKNANNIYDFCVGAKASRDYHYEAIMKGEREEYNRLIRYYVSTNGKKLIKVKNDGSTAKGVSVSQCEAGEWKCTVVNKIDKNKKINEYEIDYTYYIQKAEGRIRAIEAGRRKGGKPPSTDPNQGSLF